MRIAVDAMGGDNAPGCVVEGVASALAAFPQIEKVFLSGDEGALKKLVDGAGLPLGRVEILPASQVVEMGDPATASIRSKKDSSITVAVDAVKRGDAQAVVSAGHTGAAVAATTVKLRLLEGIRRPGIASPLPNDHGICNILDAGANVDAKPHHLLQYGIMGTVYAQHVLRVDNPRIGLMSVGEEDGKGNDFTKQVFALLKETPLNFIGNVEGHDLFEKHLDVVLCDGFVGNAVLKSCEATAKIMFKWLKAEFTRTPIRKLGAYLSRDAFRATKAKGDYENYGGSPLLGVNGICVICHGSSSSVAIHNALRVAADAVAHEVNPQIE
ncbi:MAG: phosphate acyltransferase PlsX, partial [Verrucomicrobiota bacterium]